MISVNTKRCDVCGTCAGVCAADAILIDDDTIHIEHDICVVCLACVYVCPVDAVNDEK